MFMSKRTQARIFVYGLVVYFAVYSYGCSVAKVNLVGLDQKAGSQESGSNAAKDFELNIGYMPSAVNLCNELRIHLKGDNNNYGVVTEKNLVVEFSQIANSTMHILPDCSDTAISPNGAGKIPITIPAGSHEGKIYFKFSAVTVSPENLSAFIQFDTELKTRSTMVNVMALTGMPPLINGTRHPFRIQRSRFELSGDRKCDQIEIFATSANDTYDIYNLGYWSLTNQMPGATDVVLNLSLSSADPTLSIVESCGGNNGVTPATISSLTFRHGVDHFKRVAIISTGSNTPSPNSLNIVNGGNQFFSIPISPVIIADHYEVEPLVAPNAWIANDCYAISVKLKDTNNSDIPPASNDNIRPFRIESFQGGATFYQSQNCTGTVSNFFSVPMGFNNTNLSFRLNDIYFNGGDINFRIYGRDGYIQNSDKSTMIPFRKSLEKMLGITSGAINRFAGIPGSNLSAQNLGSTLAPTNGGPNLNHYYTTNSSTFDFVANMAETLGTRSMKNRLINFDSAWAQRLVFSGTLANTSAAGDGAMLLTLFFKNDSISDSTYNLLFFTTGFYAKIENGGGTVGDVDTYLMFNGATIDAHRIGAGGWHSLTYYRSAGPTGLVKVFLDGNGPLAGAAAFTGAIPSSTLYVGSNASPAFYFKGQIAEMTFMNLSNHADLNDADLQALHSEYYLKKYPLIIP